MIVLMQLGNLAIVAAKKKDALLQVYNGEVTLHTGAGTERKSYTCSAWDNKRIMEFISHLNFGTKI